MMETCSNFGHVFLEFEWSLGTGFIMAGILFEDIFDVKDIDPEGKKFDRGKKSNLSFFFGQQSS